MVCSFTGHRPRKLPFLSDETDEKYIRLKAVLKREIKKKIESGTDTFMSGMALGIDMLAAKTVLELKEEYPSVKLVAVIPCEDQGRWWKGNDAAEYKRILSLCDEKTVLSERYTPYCMHVRNKYLVEHAQSMIAVWDGSDGGTGNTVTLAKKKGVPVTVIDPVTFEADEPITFF